MQDQLLRINLYEVRILIVLKILTNKRYAKMENILILDHNFELNEEYYNIDTTVLEFMKKNHVQLITLIELLEQNLNLFDKQENI